MQIFSLYAKMFRRKVTTNFNFYALYKVKNNIDRSICLPIFDLTEWKPVNFCVLLLDRSFFILFFSELEWIKKWNNLLINTVLINSTKVLFSHENILMKHCVSHVLYLRSKMSFFLIKFNSKNDGTGIPFSNCLLEYSSNSFVPKNF